MISITPYKIDQLAECLEKQSEKIRESGKVNIEGRAVIGLHDETATRVLNGIAAALREFAELERRS